MKDEFMDKYVPPFYFTILLDKCRIIQGNKFVEEYVTKFDEFSLVIISETCRITFKSFPKLEMDLKKT